MRIRKFGIVEGKVALVSVGADEDTLAGGDKLSAGPRATMNE